MNLIPFEMFADTIGPGHQIKNVRRAFQTEKPFAFFARNPPAIQQALTHFAQADVGVEIIHSINHGGQGSHPELFRKDRGDSVREKSLEQEGGANQAKGQADEPKQKRSAAMINAQPGRAFRRGSVFRGEFFPVRRARSRIDHSIRACFENG